MGYGGKFKRFLGIGEFININNEKRNGSRSKREEDLTREVQPNAIQLLSPCTIKPLSSTRAKV